MARILQSEDRAGLRNRILTAAARLLDTGGLDAMSTRAAASAAGVSTSVIYREFSDKEGLLDAVIEHVLQTYWADKQRVSFATDDALDDLRHLFDLHIEFGLAHPYCYTVAYVAVPDRVDIARSLSQSPFLVQVMGRLQEQGQLSVPVQDAARLMATAGIGSVLALAGDTETVRELRVAELAREAVLAVILSDPHRVDLDSDHDRRVSAIALREVLRTGHPAAMSPGEMILIDEWLQRLTQGSLDSEPARPLAGSVDADCGSTPTTRQRILRAAADLLREGGPQKVSTRSVAAAAGVQPPDLYRLFGDKDRLVDQAVAEVQREFMRGKKILASRSRDALQEFRRLWSAHVSFGLTHPEVYVLAYGHAQTGVASPASAEMSAMFAEHLAALARQGGVGLNVTQAARVALLLAVGTTMMQIPTAKRHRDHGLTALALRCAEAAVLTERTVAEPQVRTHAENLRKALRGAQRLPFSAAERSLLNEWLTELAADTTP